MYRQPLHSSTDRRTVYIQIVPQAMEQFQEKMAVHTQKVLEYLDYLGTEDCEHLRDILMKTQRFMEENK